MVDIFPTLAELCNLPVPAILSGIDLSPTLAGKTPERNSALTQYAFGYSIRTKRYRYTEWEKGERGAELYDHQNDPDEMNNLAQDSSSSKVLAELKRQLNIRIKAANEPVSRKRLR
jgi:arylsulfatase A-like enzyme